MSLWSVRIEPTCPRRFGFLWRTCCFHYSRSLYSNTHNGFQRDVAYEYECCKCGAIKAVRGYSQKVLGSDRAAQKKRSDVA